MYFPIQTSMFRSRILPASNVALLSANTLLKAGEADACTQHWLFKVS
jgi:hypothetical protein